MDVSFPFLNISILLLALFLLVALILLARKFSLEKTVDEVVNTIPPTVTKGERGISGSRLAPGGNIRVGDHILYAESEDGFIAEGVPIYISRIMNNKIYVRMDQDKTVNNH